MSNTQWIRTGEHDGFCFPLQHTWLPSPRQRNGEFEAH
jgi:hypothetical protein